jgi:hypothetical protein
MTETLEEPPDEPTEDEAAGAESAAGEAEPDEEPGTTVEGGLVRLS